MLRYEPGDTLAHRFDPRTKLLVQVGFVAAAFAHTTPRGLVALTGAALVLLAAAGLRPWRVVWGYRYALPVLVVAPLVAGAQLSPPGLDAGAVYETGLASYRVLLVLAVSGFYVATTAARESRAAVQRTVPGRTGQFLGLGVGLVFRFLPVLRRDLLRSRAAMRARLGGERPVRERMGILAASGLNRAFARADTLGLAMRARCLAWNPTLPPLSFSRWDLPGGAAAAALAAAAFI